MSIINFVLKLIQNFYFEQVIIKIINQQKVVQLVFTVLVM